MNANNISGWNYNRDDENTVTARSIKIYGSPDIVVDTASSHGLRCEVVTRPDWIGFCVVKVFATRAAHKRAQYEWLAKMISEPSATEIEL